MPYMERITDCFKNHLRHVNALCGQNGEFLYVKPYGTFNHWTLEVNMLTANTKLHPMMIVL